MSAPFIFCCGEYVFIKKLSEILSCYSDVDVIVDLNGDTDTVAFADTEAAGKHYLIRKRVLLDRLLQKLYYVLRALEMTGGTDTNLNENHILKFLSVKVMRPYTKVSWYRARSLRSIIGIRP